VTRAASFRLSQRRIPLWRWLRRHRRHKKRQLAQIDRQVRAALAEIRTCRHCHTILVQKPYERDVNFARRVFCNQSCRSRYFNRMRVRTEASA
jgi:hypothetical protein